MGESQSRYSIVQELTDSKISLIRSKSQIDERSENLKQEIKSLGVDLIQYKKTAQEDVVREVSNKEQEIEKKKDLFQFLESKKKEKVASIDSQIVEVDKALQAIEEISKAAAKEAK